MQGKVITERGVGARPSMKELKPGDWLYVWDGVAERDVWVQIADAVEVDGLMKFRAVGNTFYFSEALVVSFARAVERAAEAREVA